MNTTASQRSRHRAAIRKEREDYNRQSLKTGGWLLSIPRLPYHIRRRAPGWRREARKTQ